MICLQLPSSALIWFTLISPPCHRVGFASCCFLPSTHPQTWHVRWSVDCIIAHFSKYELQNFFVLWLAADQGIFLPISQCMLGKAQAQPKCEFLWPWTESNCLPSMYHTSCKFNSLYMLSGSSKLTYETSHFPPLFYEEYKFDWSCISPGLFLKNIIAPIHFKLIFRFFPASLHPISTQLQQGLMADGQMAPSIFIHRIPHVSHVKICLSASSVCQWVKGKVSEKKNSLNIRTWAARPKTVTERDKLRDISSVGVKMADRWMAAGRKSLCARFTNLLAFVKQKDSEQLCLPVCFLLNKYSRTFWSRRKFVQLLL